MSFTSLASPTTCNSNTYDNVTFNDTDKHYCSRATTGSERWVQLQSELRGNQTRPSWLDCVTDIWLPAEVMQSYVTVMIRVEH